MSYFRRIVYSISSGFRWISVGAISAMAFVIGANVILRQLSQPIMGTEELVGYLSAILISFALASTQIQKGHIAIDIVVSRLRKKTRVVILSIGMFFSLLIFCLVTWQMIVYGAESRHIGGLSLVLKIPVFLIIYGVAICFFLFCLVLLIDLIDFFVAEKEK
jgi:TRAP-type C4-dicarboxylate transport system permease small subunit